MREAATRSLGWTTGYRHPRHDDDDDDGDGDGDDVNVNRLSPTCTDIVDVCRESRQVHVDLQTPPVAKVDALCSFSDNQETQTS